MFIGLGGGVEAQIVALDAALRPGAPFTLPPGDEVLFARTSGAVFAAVTPGHLTTRAGLRIAVLHGAAPPGEWLDLGFHRDDTLAAIGAECVAVVTLDPRAAPEPWGGAVQIVSADLVVTADAAWPASEESQLVLAANGGRLVALTMASDGIRARAIVGTSIGEPVPVVGLPWVPVDAVPIRDRLAVLVDSSAGYGVLFVDPWALGPAHPTRVAVDGLAAGAIAASDELGAIVSCVAERAESETIRLRMFGEDGIAWGAPLDVPADGPVEGIDCVWEREDLVLTWTEGGTDVLRLVHLRPTF